MKTTLLSTCILFFACSAFGQNYIADGNAPVRTKAEEAIPAPAEQVQTKPNLQVFAPESIVDTTRRAEDIEASQTIGILSNNKTKAVEVAAAPAEENSEAVEKAVSAAKAAENVSSNEISFVKTNLRSSEYKAMVKDYTDAIKADPRAEEGYMYRAAAYIGLKDFKEAIADLSEVIRLNPENSVAFYNRGLAKMNIGDFQGGINDMTKVIRLKPGDMDAYYNRALCKMYMDHVHDAIMDLTVVIQMNPDNADAYLQRGMLKYDSEDWKGACRDWSKIAGYDERAAKAIKKYCVN